MCKGVLRKTLSGKQKLWIVFWVYYFTLGLILNTFGPLLLFFLGNMSLILLVGLAFWVAWIWFSAIAIWRNSDNSSSHYFGVAAKTVFVLWPVAGIFYEVWRATST
jgi:hypothetical protein